MRVEWFDREDLLQRRRHAIAGLQQDLKTMRGLREVAEGRTSELQREVTSLQAELILQSAGRLLASRVPAARHFKERLSALKDQLARSAQDQADLQTQSEDLKAELLNAKRLLEDARNTDKAKAI